MISVFCILDRHPIGLALEIQANTVFRMAKPFAADGSFFALNLKIPFAAVLFSLFF
jgi:hypothetical protein